MHRASWNSPGGPCGDWLLSISPRNINHAPFVVFYLQDGPASVTRIVVGFASGKNKSPPFVKSACSAGGRFADSLWGNFGAGFCRGGQLFAGRGRGRRTSFVFAFGHCDHTFHGLDKAALEP